MQTTQIIAKEINNLQLTGSRTDLTKALSIVQNLSTNNDIMTISGLMTYKECNKHLIANIKLNNSLLKAYISLLEA